LKKLDWLIIRSFLGPFVMTFFIAVFVLVMIFLWRYIEDLASKGLGFVFISRLLFYASATTVPMALPVAVLLSSFMTIGNFAESIELAAAKSSGISLTRFIRPMFFLVVCISGIAFFFANNVLPIVNFKLKGIQREIGTKMPAIDIQEGMYYEGLKGFTLKVDKKEDDQKSFHGLVVYDHTPGTGGAENIIKAGKGDIQVSDDGNYVILNLHNGVRYSDMNFFNRKQAGYPFSREYFKEQHIIIDISELNKSAKNNNNNYIGNQYTMMTVGQLNLLKEETKLDIKKSATGFIGGLSNYYAYLPKKDPAPNQPLDFNTGPVQDMNMNNPVPLIAPDTTLPKRTIEKVEWGGQFFNAYTPQEKTAITNNAVVQVNSLKTYIDQHQVNLRQKESNIIRNRVEYNRKFSLSLACILFFFIGAPLGAIIRKGGFGWPLIVSIVLYIIYYIITTVFEKSVRSASLGLEGLWYSSFMLLPLGLFLTLKASSDSGLFLISTYLKPFKKLFGKKVTA
jgi:lipopolysaccharide export system permease protein